MDRTYELTAGDLAEVQSQLIAQRRERLRDSVAPLAWATLLAGVLLWPMVAHLSRQPVFSVPGTHLAVKYLLLLGIGGVATRLLRKRLPAPRPVSRRTLERLGRAMARRSVLGPIQLTVDGAGLTRKNAQGELRVAPGEVREVLASEWGLTVQLRGQRRVIPIPARAHASPEEAQQLRAAVEALRAPAAPQRPRAVRPGLLLLLGYAAFVLAAQQALARYHDPRRSNPADHVVLYGTTWCPVCARLRKCLRSERVPFEERDVEHTARGRAEWEELGDPGVPVLLVGSEVLYGLDREALHGALARHGYQVYCR